MMEIFNPEMVQIFSKKECDVAGFIKKTFNDDDESLFIVGGDGTYLKALAKYERGAVPPIYAFNTGTIGALIPFFSSQAFSLADKITKKELPFLSRNRLYVSSHKMYVANDLIIYSEAHALARFNIYINSENIKINGDGITIATSCGSTGHSYSINGPVLLTDGIILNCNAPNRCNFRPLVLPLDTKIRIETSGCIGVFDNRLSVKCDVFELDGWDSYSVAVDESYEMLSVVKRQFSLR